MWTPIFYAESGNKAHTAGDVTLTPAAGPISSGSTVQPTAYPVSLTATPVINLAAYNTSGWAITTSATYKPPADTGDFYSRGSLYSAALLTLS